MPTPTKQDIREKIIEILKNSPFRKTVPADFDLKGDFFKRLNIDKRFRSEFNKKIASKFSKFKVKILQKDDPQVFVDIVKLIFIKIHGETAWYLDELLGIWKYDRSVLNLQWKDENAVMLSFTSPGVHVMGELSGPSKVFSAAATPSNEKSIAKGEIIFSDGSKSPYELAVKFGKKGADGNMKCTLYIRPSPDDKNLPRASLPNDDDGKLVYRPPEDPSKKREVSLTHRV